MRARAHGARRATRGRDVAAGECPRPGPGSRRGARRRPADCAVGPSLDRPAARGPRRVRQSSLDRSPGDSDRLAPVIGRVGVDSREHRLPPEVCFLYVGGTVSVVYDWRRPGWGQEVGAKRAIRFGPPAPSRLWTLPICEQQCSMCASPNSPQPLLLASVARHRRPLGPPAHRSCGRSARDIERSHAASCRPFQTHFVGAFQRAHTAPFWGSSHTMSGAQRPRAPWDPLSQPHRIAPWRSHRFSAESLP